MRFNWLIFCLLCSRGLLAQMQITGISSTPATCSSNGSVTVTVQGGTPVYCYRIDGGACLFSNATTFTFTDLTPGTKTISVTDGPNTTTLTVNAVVQGNYQVPSLFGLAQGCGVYAQASGGLPPYQYAISLAGGPFSPLQGNPQFTPVVGNYCIRVYDACNNFTEYCGIIDISAVDFTAACCENNSSPNEICVRFTDREGLHANDPGYWFGGQPPYTYSATAAGLTVTSPDGNFQLQQLCPGWTFTITDACGNTATRTPNCMKTEALCVDCADGTAEIVTTNGVPPYVYYYQEANGTWQPNPAGGTSGSFTGLPIGNGGYTFRAVDACGNESPPIEVQCLDATGSFDCRDQSVYIQPLTDFYPVDVMCFTCTAGTTVTLDQPGNADFPMLGAGDQIFMITDVCGDTLWLYCHDTVPDLTVTKSCNSVEAIMRSNYICNGETGTFSLTTGVWYEIALASQPGIPVDGNNSGQFSGLIPGQTYIITATHGVCGTATTQVTLFTGAEFSLTTEIKTTSFLVNGVCQTGYQVMAALSPAPEMTPVFDLVGTTGFTDTTGVFPDILPGTWNVSAYNYCVSEQLELPDWKPEMTVAMPECPNGGCVQMTGALTPMEWQAWGAGYGLNIVSNSDFYILDCPGFNGPQCVANWGGNICNLIPGNSYSVYLKPGTFTCPVDTISFIVDPTGTARIDSVMLTTPVTCNTSELASLLVTVVGGKDPIYLEVIDSITGQVLRTIPDADINHEIFVDSLESLKTYFFRVVDACNNTRDASATVILLPSVTAEFDRDCAGNLHLETAAILNANYIWTDESGAVLASGPNLWELDLNTPADTTAYAVEIAFGNCQNHITSIAVPGFTPPSVALPFADTLLCGNFSLQINAIPGPGNYTFLWSTGETTDAITVSTTGTYTVVATDAFGCSDSTEVQIATSQAMNLNVATTDVLCFGEPNGSAAITPSGGTPPFQFLWENNDTAPVRTDLPAGTYQVTVTDSPGCTETVTFMIGEPAAITLGFSSNPALCSGASDGSVQVTASGGTGGFQFVWSTAATGNVLTGVPAGMYTVTATDSNNCTHTGTVSIAEPPPLLNSFLVENVDCFGGNNGSITATTTGGTGTLMYSWSAPGGSNAILQNLNAGQYTLTITDQNNCTLTDTATITQPEMLAVVLTGTNILCAGSANGSIAAQVTGGTAPAVSYFWSNGQTTSSINGLIPGIYTVTVNDSNACADTTSVEITAPPPLVVNAVSTPPPCVNGPGGMVTATASGGAGGYEYFWSFGATTASVIGLNNGPYTVTVTDDNGCTATAITSVGAPPPIMIALSAQPVKCFGGMNGAITTAVSGGTGMFSAIWSNSQTTADIQNLAAGIYTVTVTDQNNCTASATATVTTPAALQVVDIATTDAGCDGNDGTAKVVIAGGAAPYTAVWSNNQSGLNIQNLIPGIYTVTVTDSNNCTAVSADTIGGSDPLTVELSVQDIPCFGENSGAVFFENIEGGTGSPYYLDGEPMPADMFVGGLPAGTYNWTISDGNGCQVNVTATINQPPKFSFSLPELIQIDLGEEILLKPQLTGTPKLPVSWQWTPSTGLACDTCFSTTALVFETTQYLLTGIDANGCTATGVVRIFVDRNCSVYVANVFTPLIGGPNDLLVINAGICVKKILEWRIFDRWGGMMFSQKDFLPNDFKHAWDGTSRNKQVEMGVYTWYARYELIDGTEYLIVGDVTVVY